MKKISIVLALLVLSACEESPEAKERRVARGAIEICQKNLEEQRANRAPYSMLSFLTQACQKMEADYEKKYR